MLHRSSSVQPAAAAVVATSTTGSGAIAVDESQPVTSIQLRLLDGSRQVVKLNHSHQVKDLHSVAQAYVLCIVVFRMSDI